MYTTRVGTLEKENRKQIRITKIQSAVLKTVGAVGVISVALVLPNALQVLRLFNGNQKLRDNGRRAINNSRKRLIESGLLEYAKEGFIRLTPLGKKTLLRIQLSNYQTNIPKKWDKKWRILIFDIQETQSRLRDKVRNTLISIGFSKLQNSVWVYPYDCEDLITLLKADFEVGKELLYIIADKIENEKVLLNDFGLD